MGWWERLQKINPEILDPLISKGYIPIISSIGSTLEVISHNINSDFVAGEIAAAINAEKLILLTDTKGILKEKDNKNSLVEKTNLKEARDFIDKKICLLYTSPSPRDGCRSRMPSSA